MNRTPFLDCKHKHMMKNGAPPDKFGVLHHVEFHGFTSKINFRGLSLVGFWYDLDFLEQVLVPLTFSRLLYLHLFLFAQA